MLTFEKKKSSAVVGSESDFKVYIYKHPKSDGTSVAIVFRLARSVIDKAGWFVGDHAIPSIDEHSKTWVLSRTSDRSKGYMVTSTDKAVGKSVYMKLTASRDAAEAAVPGGVCDCKIVSADSRAIVGSF
jgi:hypothetical protein